MKTDSQLKAMVDSACSEKYTELKIELTELRADFKIGIQKLQSSVEAIKKNLEDSLNADKGLHQKLKELEDRMDDVDVAEKVRIANRKLLYAIGGFLGLSSLPNFINLVQQIIKLFTKQP
jgi:ribosomal protein L29